MVAADASESMADYLDVSTFTRPAEYSRHFQPGSHPGLTQKVGFPGRRRVGVCF